MEDPEKSDPPPPWPEYREPEHPYSSRPTFFSWIYDLIAFFMVMVLACAAVAVNSVTIDHLPKFRLTSVGIIGLLFQFTGMFGERQTTPIAVSMRNHLSLLAVIWMWIIWSDLGCLIEEPTPIVLMIHPFYFSVLDLEILVICVICEMTMLSLVNNYTLLVVIIDWVMFVFFYPYDAGDSEQMKLLILLVFSLRYIALYCLRKLFRDYYDPPLTSSGFEIAISGIWILAPASGVVIGIGIAICTAYQLILLVFVLDDERKKNN